MRFFIEQNGKSIGPICDDDIHKYKITKETLVWEEGMTNWKKAADVSIFHAYIRATDTPPPLPNSRDFELSQMYDLTVPKEKGLIQTGVGIIVVSIVVGIIGYFNLPEEQIPRYGMSKPETDNFVPIVITIVAAALKIFAVSQVIPVAKKLNRDPIGWALFAFLFPGIALIVLGTKNKVREE